MATTKKEKTRTTRTLLVYLGDTGQAVNCLARGTLKMADLLREAGLPAPVLRRL